MANIEKTDNGLQNTTQKTKEQHYLKLKTGD